MYKLPIYIKNRVCFSLSVDARRALSWFSKFFLWCWVVTAGAVSQGGLLSSLMDTYLEYCNLVLLTSRIFSMFRIVQFITQSNLEHFVPAPYHKPHTSEKSLLPLSISLSLIIWSARLTGQPRLAWNSLGSTGWSQQCFCLTFLSTGVTGVSHQAWPIHLLFLCTLRCLVLSCFPATGFSHDTCSPW